MNRLVIVGNGFDLAHGLPTSYYQFILWYLKDCFRQADQSREYEDHLFSIKRVNSNATNIEEYKTVQDFQYFLVDKNDRHIHKKANELMHPRFKLLALSDFAFQLLTECFLNNWVDIENLFYKSLRAASLLQNSLRQPMVNKVNAQLHHLKIQLEKYLAQLRKASPIEELQQIFKSPAETIHKSSPVNKTLILDFNYTSTTDLYGSSKDSVLHIHGKINSPENQIIFGFGDELDDRYQFFKLEEDCDYVAHLKSFLYPMTNNFHDLMKFIGSDKSYNITKAFEVVILGHSCGRSDRTLLNMIFEHPNCASIRVYYHGTKNNNNFRSISNNMARHFHQLRWYGRMIPFHRCLRMPQYND